MNSPTPEAILAQSAALSRSGRLRSLYTKQQNDANRTQYSATLTGFDAATGLWLCQLPDGSTIHARSISSTGGKGVGSVVSLYKPTTGMAIVKWL